MNLDLEALKHIFKDNREHIAVGVITKIEVAADRSFLRCMIDVWPEVKPTVAKMTWEMVGPESGIFSFPQVNDMVLVAFTNDNECYVIRRLTSKVDKIPAKALDGHMIFKALAGKELWAISNEKIYLAESETAPTENLVLGQQLKALLIDILTQLSELSNKVATHTHSGNLGYPTSTPLQTADFVSIKAEFDNLKASPVEDEGILSQKVFTD